ncbi:hypothetical protein [Raineyella fluvialis]|uniref:hypothetical protein n=1 Tax=Raineyella fluvialis TaxID=2662261 RepID=UPI00189016E7|nr:hypothetical protein [Raineyella fluvialis]
MCRPVTCSSCGKTTWAGCGQHVASVKASVPAGQWCTCDRNAASSSTSGNFMSFFRR